MRTVFKYRLAEVDAAGIASIPTEFTRSMPAGAEVLCVQMQNGLPCLWARVWTDHPPETRRFVLGFTGRVLPADAGRYVGTLQIGGIVLHIFEAPPLLRG